MTRNTTGLALLAVTTLVLSFEGRTPVPGT